MVSPPPPHAAIEPPGRRVAVIGSGVSGLVTAHLLRRHHEVTLFEASDRLGGHANTVAVDIGGRHVDVDTGFLVYNEPNYPGFTALLDELGVRTKPTEMSFSVTDEHAGLEWRGTSFTTIFAQRRRIVDPKFLRMLREIPKFNRRARELLTDEGQEDLSFTLADLVEREGLSTFLRDWYLVPMGSAIWSADPTTFLGYPAAVFARFFANHGLLNVRDQPEWRTIVGGSKNYVEAIAAPMRDRIRLSNPVVKIVRRKDGIEVTTVGGPPEHYDRVVLATHSDQALRLLSDPTHQEREILGAIRYQPNVATLHTDSALLPHSQVARAAWNYHVLDKPASELGTRATLTYHLNTLQGLDVDADVCVSLNRPEDPAPDRIIQHIDYAHPVFDAPAIEAQRRLSEINGVGGTYFCGAYWRYGFHEDGVQSAFEVARHFGVAP